MELEALYGDQAGVSASGSDSDLVLYFPFHKQALKWVKSIEGAEYQSYDKAWSFPITAQNRTELAQLICALRALFREEAEKNLFQAELQMDLAEPLLESLQADFEHSRLHLATREGYIELSCPYDPKTIKLLKKIPGKQWLAGEKVWLLPADQEVRIRKALNTLLSAI